MENSKYNSILITHMKGGEKRDTKKRELPAWNTEIDGIDKIADRCWNLCDFCCFTKQQQKTCLYVVSTQMYINFNEKVFRNDIIDTKNNHKTQQQQHKKTWMIYAKVFQYIFFTFQSHYPTPLCLSVAHRQHFSFHSQNNCKFLVTTFFVMLSINFLCIEFYLLFACIPSWIAFQFAYNLEWNFRNLPVYYYVVFYWWLVYHWTSWIQWLLF